MTKEDIAKVLKQLRTSAGLTQKEAAERLGKKQQTIASWESGQSQPDANTLFVICSLYGTSVDEAFGFKKDGTTIGKKDIDLIEKYHSLDDCGRQHVDIILQWESDRVAQIQQKVSPAPSVVTQARLIQYYQRLASAGSGQVVFDGVPVGQIEIPNKPEYRRVSYAIGVNGRSMEPLYKDGDILLVEPTCQIEPGEVGIFIVGDKAFVKKLGKTELISANADYDNIPLTEDTKCMGRVVDKL